MNITGAIAGNPRFHYIKTILCKNCRKHTFSDNNGIYLFCMLTILELVLNFHTQISCSRKTLWSLRSQSDFTLTLDYLNPALKNPALTYTHLLSSTDFWSIRGMKRSPLRTIFLLKLLHKTKGSILHSACSVTTCLTQQAGLNVTIFSLYYIFTSSVIY